MREGRKTCLPLDDISQTSLPSASYDSTSDTKAYTKSQRRRKEIEDGTIDIDRNPLGISRLRTSMLKDARLQMSSLLRMRSILRQLTLVF